MLAFGSRGTESTLTNWTAIFCTTEFHTTASQSAFAFAAFAASMTIGRLGGDALTKRFGRHKLFVISLLVAFAGLTSVLSATNIFVVTVSLAFVGLGLSSIVPLTYSAAGNTEGVLPTVGIPMISIFGYSSFFIMPPLVGYLSDALGLRFAFGVLLGLVALMMILVFMSFRRTSERFSFKNERSSTIKNSEQ